MTTISSDSGSSDSGRGATRTWDERPWGSWHVLAEGDGWKVKRLVVRPHARLSLQSHQHRSEHWTVLAGVASCQVDSVPTEVRVGDEVHVPCGSTHRIANTGEEWLEIVELQLGDYLGEDDIVRLEDDYGRC